MAQVLPDRSVTDGGEPDARLVVYNNGGHMAMIRSEFNRDVLAFLGLDC